MLLEPLGGDVAELVTAAGDDQQCAALGMDLVTTPVQNFLAGRTVPAGLREGVEVVGNGIEMPNLADVTQRVVDIDDHRWLTRH